MSYKVRSMCYFIVCDVFIFITVVFFVYRYARPHSNFVFACTSLLLAHWWP